ncbi:MULTISPECIES: response regulator [unclassified Variovorax]|uniref:response regulator n=1 Tax=unclassified Variovorax TaxID=663243 RepID=UPI00076D125E|nr:MULTISPECIES: response regulator [unclassified Variovorax]KWT92004.1 Chemotaxis protein methyltransferase CheR [Variovorax sp. WDL1]PNG51509.1 Autoinducer 2 sensor kinase/phosphatase LuxQ [Variovorax sp. B2]PNG54465.1 Autoinducer 2 sensor kinase/phosphatase LuxQ [Variovorax sp. B4]VTV11972.1 Autoinducer 2 sensor kinase/phosphatase LuxQ [Variovorax sp. WDL1]
MAVQINEPVTPPEDADPDLDPAAGEEKADILVVDDLPEKLLVFRTVLEELGQNLVLVRSGADALREILQREFAVILLDVNMPGIDGFETATLIRQHRRCAHTPIIFITSYADEMQTARGYSLGAVDYILSPVVPEILRSKVSVFVALHQMRRQVRRQADARAAVMVAQAARRVAEENDRRSAFLAHASRVLSGSLQIGVAMKELAGLLVPELAPLALVLLADPDFGAGEMVAAGQAPGAQLQLSTGPEMRLDERLRAALGGAVRERQAVGLDEAALAALTPAAFGLAAGGDAFAPLRSAQAVPLVFGERVLGVVLIARSDAGERSVAEAGLLEELAARAATAFENARLYLVLQREMLERQAAQEELQRTNQRKDEFLAMMSHELRNPLAPIHTAVQVIRRVAAPHPKVAWALDIAERQLKQLTRLIEELLDVARISQGKIVLKHETLDLNTVVAQSVETVQPFVDARRQALRVVVPQQPAWLLGDMARLTQVIANLLHNAAKYSPEGTRIELVSRLEGEDVVLSVRDQGIGMDAELLPRIFDLFAQGERGLDRSQGGLGVGLTLARRLTEMHGGRLEAHSEGRDRGSEFRLRLPRVGTVLPAQAAPLLQTAAASPSESLRILVVDDNHDAATVIATMLELEGHAVRTAHDGEEALSAALAHSPVVVVLDIGLPLLDGYEVARRLRAMPELASALLIAVTGYGQSEDRAAALGAGFDRHFVKPADPEALLACIREWSVQRAQEEAANRQASAAA